MSGLPMGRNVVFFIIPSDSLPSLGEEGSLEVSNGNQLSLLQAEQHAV